MSMPSLSPQYWDQLLIEWLRPWRALLIKNHSGWPASLAWRRDWEKEKTWQNTTSLAEGMCWEILVCYFHQIRPCRFRDAAALAVVPLSCDWATASSCVLHWCGSTSRSTPKAGSRAGRTWRRTQSGSDWDCFQVMINDTKKKKIGRASENSVFSFLLIARTGALLGLFVEGWKWGALSRAEPSLDWGCGH